MRDKRERRRGRRRGGRNQAQETAVAKMVQPLHNLPVYDLVDDATLDQIHHASMQVLSEIGIAFLEEESQAILQEQGVEVRDDIAYFDPAVVEEYVAKAPGQFTQLARNPDRSVIIGGNHLCFAPVYGPPYVYDMDHGRREATLTDFQNFVKLAYLSPYIHHSGGTIVEPTDDPPHTRHLDMLFSHIKYSDKPFMGGVIAAGSCTLTLRINQKSQNGRNEDGLTPIRPEKVP